VPNVHQRSFHPWHDIPTGPKPPTEVTAVIEIPTNERNKYELDKELGVFRLDRVLYSAVHYPGDYGFLPRTLGDDGDPLASWCWAIRSSQASSRPGPSACSTSSIRARRTKVLAVPLGGPYADGRTTCDIPAHYLKEIEHFFGSTGSRGHDGDPGFETPRPRGSHRQGSRSAGRSRRPTGRASSPRSG
jgi:inorganic pyrophosphatase